MSKFRALLLAVLMLVVSVINVTSVAVAQDSQQAGSGLIISPTRTELEIMPGGTGTVSITLRNVSGGETIARAEVNDFVSDDNTGNPRIIPNSEEQLPTSIKDFIVNLENIELADDEKKDIELAVEIPADTAPGAYYGVVRYTAVPANQQDDDDDDRQIALSASLGSLVLITVPGDIQEQIQVNSFEVLRDGNAGTFFTQAPNEAALDIRNLGNGFAKPFGRIVLTRGGQTGEEVYAYELNNVEPKANVLPNSSRVFTDSIDGVDRPGKYTLTASVSYGNGGEVISQSVSFWYVPVWLIALIVGTLLALIVGGYIFYRVKFRKNKRR